MFTEEPTRVELVGQARQPDDGYGAALLEHVQGELQRAFRSGAVEGDVHAVSHHALQIPLHVLSLGVEDAVGAHALRRLDAGRRDFGDVDLQGAGQLGRQHGEQTDRACAHDARAVAGPQAGLADRTEANGEGLAEGALLERDAVGKRDHLVFGHLHVLGVSSAAQRRHPIAGPDLLDARADLRDQARDLVSHDAARWHVADVLEDVQVRATDAAVADLDQHFALLHRRHGELRVQLESAMVPIHNGSHVSPHLNAHGGPAPEIGHRRAQTAPPAITCPQYTGPSRVGGG